MTDPVQPAKLQASQGPPGLQDVIFNPPKKYDYFEHLTLSTRYQEWDVWYQYKFKHTNANGKQGHEITNVKISQYLLRGALHLWGPFTVFMEGGVQNGDVEYDRKFSSQFDVNLDVQTISPSSMLGAGMIIKFWGADGEAMSRSSFVDFYLENSASFVITHREIRANELTVDMGQGLKADFTNVTGNFIKDDRVTYQMALINTKATFALTPWKWFQPFGSVGQAFMDTRLYMTPTPMGHQVLKMGGVRWQDVKNDLDLKEIGWMYEAGATSDILTLGGLLMAMAYGLPVSPRDSLFEKVALLATFKRGYMPLEEGRNKFKADTRAFDLGLKYYF